MKKLRPTSAVCILLLLILFMKITDTQVLAAELELEADLYQLYHFDISDTWTSEGEKIISYDVSEQGQIAIAFTNRTIGVFDHDMNFLYQLSFESNGSYGVLWLDEKLVFIDIYSDTAIVFDTEGVPEMYYRITGPKNYSFDIIEERVRKQGNDQYFCTNGSGGNNPLGHYRSYTILKRTSEDGAEEILYETEVLVDDAFVAKITLMAFLSFPILMLVGVIVMWFLIKRLNKKS